MRATTLSLSVVLLLAVILTGCSQEVIYTGPNETKDSDASQKQDKIDYIIINDSEYDPELCGSTSHGDAYPGGFNEGLKVTMIDKLTGDPIDNKYAHSSINGGYVPRGYMCKEGMSDSLDNVVVYASAYGYSPLVFRVEPPKNKLATIEVQMIRSCSGGPSCFDNLEISKSSITEISTSKEWLYNTIKRNFGLDKGDYNTSCIECNMDRGGFIKAKGIYKDGSEFELYYKMGFCSSGGSDCGWSACFSSGSGQTFEPVKDVLCNKTYSAIHNNPVCGGTPYDGAEEERNKLSTEEVRNRCRTGEFETSNGDMRTISIVQSSSRCSSSVRVGNFDCIGS